MGLVCFALGTSVFERGGQAAEPVLVCDQGQLSPPDAMFDYEIGFAHQAEAHPQALAEQRGRDKLVERLCGANLPCDEIRRLIKLEQIGAGGERVCAMVTVNRQKLASLLAEVASIEPLERGMTEVTKTLREEMRRLRPSLRAPKVAVGVISDTGGGGTPLIGGPRAQWLAQRVSLLLREAGFVVVAATGNAPAQGLGRQVDLLVEAVTCERVEKGSPIFEVVLVGRLSDGTQLSLRPAQCGVAALQLAGVPRPAALEGKRKVGFADPGLRLDISSGEGGAVCEGDRVHIHLTADRALEVRVFDLYGSDGGLLIFPNESQPSGRVRANERVALGGPSGFDVLLIPGSEHERYLVMAAPEVEGLGPWGRLTETCRLSDAAAKLLRDAERADFPSAMSLHETGFRVVREGCSRAPSDADKRALMESLQSIPRCR